MKKIIILAVTIFFCIGCQQAAAPTQTNANSITNTNQSSVNSDSKTDSPFSVSVYQEGKAYQGTTLFADLHILKQPRLVEVDMQGQKVWEYQIPAELAEYTNPGLDVELLDNGNIMYLLPLNGVYEITRDGEVVWSFLHDQVSHDADRLANGNTLIAWGGNDKRVDSQVKEVNPAGEIVWEWQAGPHFSAAEYDDKYCQGFSHVNGVDRMVNGNTLVSVRNFDLIAEVNPAGELVRTIGKDIVYHPHGLEVTADGSVLTVSQSEFNICDDPNHKPDPSILTYPGTELDPQAGEVVWSVDHSVTGYSLFRDADRLPNGNTLMVGIDRIVEVTADKEVVWQLDVTTKETTDKSGGPHKSLYKAERIGQ